MKETMRSGDEAKAALDEQQELWQTQLDAAPRN